jgi:hypothetical protein
VGGGERIAESHHRITLVVEGASRGVGDRDTVVEGRRPSRTASRHSRLVIFPHHDRKPRASAQFDTATNPPLNTPARRMTSSSSTAPGSAAGPRRWGFRSTE